MNPPLYLDAHATTPCDPRVVEEMLPCFGRDFGNPASRSHAYGWRAEALVERARERVAELVGGNPREILFTSGATESDNLAIHGVLRRPGAKGRHVVASAIEHKAVLDPCRRLERDGFRATFVRPGPGGRIDPDAVAAAIEPDTALVSLMLANNEIGTIQPVAAVGRICKERGVFFHCDAVQGLGWLRCDVEEAGIDLLSISAHKIYGPKGVGALWLRRRDPRVRIEPLFQGGGQERGLRSGTLNVPGIVGLGAACEIARLERDAHSARVGPLRDRLLRRLREAFPDLRVNGSLEHRLPNNLNVSIPGVDSDALLGRLTGDLAASSSSACASDELQPSYVLVAMGADEETLRGAVRFGLLRTATEEEIDFAARRVVEEATRLREEGPGEALECGTACPLPPPPRGPGPRTPS